MRTNIVAIVIMMKCMKTETKIKRRSRYRNCGHDEDANQKRRLEKHMNK